MHREVAVSTHICGVEPLVDGVGYPCDRVINAGYCYWYVLDTVVPRCVLLSVTCPTNSSAFLSTCHVPANLIQRPTRCRVIVHNVVALILSAVHQWVGYPFVARWAILVRRGMWFPRPLLLFIILRCCPLCHASCNLASRFSDHPSPSIIPEGLLLLAVRCDSFVLCLLVASESTLSRP